MVVNPDHFKEKLLQKKRECEAQIERLQQETRATADTEVRDEGDDAVTALLASEALEEASVQSRTLQLVNAALGRIADGSYGACLACDRPIETARLEAIPWAEFCLKDQEKRDKKDPAAFTSATL